MIDLLRRRPAFFRLWAAGTVSLAGDWLGFVALSRLALDQGGGALSLALVFAGHSLPRAWLTPLAGVVADRFDRRKLLVWVPIVQALLTALMALSATRNLLALVQVLLLFRSGITAFMVPAEAAALRHTVEPDELLRGNSILASTWSVMFVVGMALGGALAALGPGPALVLDALSFVLATLLARGLPAMRPPENEARLELGKLLLSMPRDLWAAASHARARPPLLRAVLSKAPVAIAGGAGWMVLNLVADRAEPFGSAAISLGVMQAVRGSGTGLGPLAVTLLSGGEPKTRFFDHASALATFLGIIVFPLVMTHPWMLLVAALVWGMGGGGNWVLSSAALQKLAPDAMVGRLSSLDELGHTASMVLGALVSGFFVERGASLVHVAAVGTSIGLLSWVWVSRSGARDVSAAAATVV